jgi:hypothetical protein
MITVQPELITVNIEPPPGFLLRIVENPLAVLLALDTELWLYWHSHGNRSLSGWYFCFECTDGRRSQLFGPFYSSEHAEQFAHSQDYWRSLRWQHRI